MISLYCQFTNVIVSAPLDVVGKALDCIDGTVSQAVRDGFSDQVMPRLITSDLEPVKTLAALLNVLAGHTVGEANDVMWRLRGEINKIIVSATDLRPGVGVMMPMTLSFRPGRDSETAS